jgi:hypothetical protein
MLFRRTHTTSEPCWFSSTRSKPRMHARFKSSRRIIQHALAFRIPRSLCSPRSPRLLVRWRSQLARPSPPRPVAVRALLACMESSGERVPGAFVLLAYAPLPSLARPVSRSCRSFQAGVVVASPTTVNPTTAPPGPSDSLPVFKFIIDNLVAGQTSLGPLVDDLATASPYFQGVSLTPTSRVATTSVKGASCLSLLHDRGSSNASIAVRGRDRARGIMGPPPARRPSAARDRTRHVCILPPPALQRVSRVLYTPHDHREGYRLRDASLLFWSSSEAVLTGRAGATGMSRRRSTGREKVANPSSRPPPSTALYGRPPRSRRCWARPETRTHGPRRRTPRCPSSRASGTPIRSIVTAASASASGSTLHVRPRRRI